MYAILNGKIYTLGLHDGALEWDHQPEMTLANYFGTSETTRS